MPSDHMQQQEMTRPEAQAGSKQRGGETYGCFQYPAMSWIVGMLKELLRGSHFASFIGAVLVLPCAALAVRT